MAGKQPYHLWQIPDSEWVSLPHDEQQLTSWKIGTASLLLVVLVFFVRLASDLVLDIRSL